MIKKRAFLTGLTALFVAELFAIAIHGFVLAGDYAPYYGTLLRDTDSPKWQTLLLTVAHGAYVGGLVWIYEHARFGGERAVRGLKLGLLGWVIGQVPLWLIWFAEQPWPNSLIGKQLLLELAASLVVGLTIAAMMPRIPQNSRGQSRRT